MRLSEIIFNDKYRDETELLFFHGTATKWLDSFQQNGIRIVKVNKKKDFGQGFYLTSRYWQAKEYANKMAHGTRTESLIIACIIPLGNLRKLTRKLIIDQYNEEWLGTIIRGRFHSKENPLSNNFDFIYGRVGDGRTPFFEKKFLEKQDTEDLKTLLPHIIPNKKYPHYEYDQLWLGTKEAINCIKSFYMITKEGIVDGKIFQFQ